MSFRDVTIKIPDRGYDVTHRKRGRRFEKSQLVLFLPGRRTVDFRGSSWPDDFVRYGCRALVGLRADDVKAVSIEELCLSLPYVENPFNSKVIKSFVPELRSRKCFSCFRIHMFYVYMLSTFYVRFIYPFHGFVTSRLSKNRFS